LDPIILVGIDFSDGSHNAVLEARRVARATGATLESVHVRPGLRRELLVLDGDERTWLESVGLDEAGLRLRCGTPWIELVRLAREHEAEMVVVGAHGAAGFQPVGLGSTAERLALMAPSPVLIVGRRDANTRDGEGRGLDVPREVSMGLTGALRR